LLWAYVPISKLHDIIELDSLPEDEPFFPKLHCYIFQKGRLILPLEKSESFYLWTEIHKSSLTEQIFKPIYSLSFGENLTYWGANPNKRQHRYEYKKITTDGRFFKFEYKNRSPITYDLGYNFIERNFEQNNFIKLQIGEEWIF
ncbi:MAG: hypothetical protein LBV75_06195, partial [Paludibacter sp.]|nr:hypothetical protein [Paludibacter sp.]